MRVKITLFVSKSHRASANHTQFDENHRNHTRSCQNYTLAGCNHTFKCFLHVCVLFSHVSVSTRHAIYYCESFLPKCSIDLSSIKIEIQWYRPAEKFEG
jgi:hypothetical protein